MNGPIAIRLDFALDIGRVVDQSTAEARLPLVEVQGIFPVHRDAQITEAASELNFTGPVAQGVTHNLYSIPHGYGYIPFTIVNIEFLDDSDGEHVGLGFAGVGVTLAIDAYCTSTHFKVDILDDFFWTGPNANLQVSYYIFAENGI
jgi:hypothetical protein